MEKGLHEKTGKSLAEWIAIVEKQKLEKHGQIVNFLKTEHGMTHGYANFVAHKALASDASEFDPDDLVAAQYNGKKNLKAIYDRLVAEIAKFGNDVEFAPKKANVSVRRKKQFALIQPTTKTRMDLGLKFKDKPTGGRLEDSGIFGAMCTHRVRLSEPGEVDAELIGWLKEAYEGAS